MRSTRARTLDIAGGTRNFEGAGTATGNGAFRLSGGVLDVNTGSLPKLDLAGGVLTRTTAGDLTIAGAFNVSGGAVGAAPAGESLVTEGTTNVTGPITLSRDWTNRGVVNLSSGQIGASPGSGVDFTNAGTLDLANTTNMPFVGARSRS